ncbi:MAG TPA: AlkA N-terminal domain-containing protein [Pyrinomonadaceae bacterium]|jgi:DNA-3-methyladenine glycosylase II
MEIIIRPRAPFDFAATARFLRFTEREAVDTFADGRYRRALHLGGRLHLLNVASTGTTARPLLGVTLEGRGRATVREQEEAGARVRQIFSTEHDLKKFRARVAGDPLMSKIEAAHRGLHIARWPSVFEALVISILSQQISTVVAMTLKRRVVEKYGERLEGGGETFLAFPRAEVLAEAEPQELRALGLSGSKVAAVTELAQRARAGELDEGVLGRDDNEALIARLTKLRGIGRWTAEWALMLHFGRTDVFPAGDLALRGFVVKYYKDGGALAEREIRALAQTLWGEWASYAAVYFLAGMRAGTINLRPERAIINAGPGA